MQHRRLLWITIVLAGFVFAGCSPSEQTASPSTQTRPSTAGGADAAQLQFVGAVATGTGKVVLAQPADLSFSTPGQVIELTVEEGDIVQAGQVIARLDTAIVDTTLKRAEADLAVSQAELAKVQAGASEEEIREAQSLATAVPFNWSMSPGQRPAEQEAAQARLDYLLAQPFPEDLALAQARVREAETVVAMAQAERDQATMMSPIDGEGARVFIHDYEHVESGQVVVQIGDMSLLRIEITDMTENDIARVKEGNSANVMFDALPGIKVPGTVTAIFQADRGVAAFVVVVDVEQFPEGIRPGMTAYVTIAVE